MGKTLIVGLGSSYGDDQIGWLVARQLQAWPIENAEVRALSDPLQLVDLLSTDLHLVLIDACESGRPAGSIVHLDFEGLEPAHLSGSAHSSHGMSVFDALAIAHSLGRVPRQISFYGIEIGDTPCSDTLLDPVTGPIHDVTKLILSDLRKQSSIPHA